MWALGLCLLAVGCRGAAERCAEHQASAAQAWQRYVGALEGELAGARAGLADTAEKERSLRRGLASLALQRADRLHRPATSAWHRTYQATLQAACTRDERCMAMRVQRRNLEREAEHLEAQLGRARAALRASGLSRDAARSAAAAVEKDFERAAYKDARAESEGAFEACEGVETASEG